MNAHTQALFDLSTATPVVPSRPLIVDSFAGGGGASTGIELALGRSPDIAINHSSEALALHAANHPDTIHLDSNIWDVSPLEVTKGRHLGLFWASPDCKHFSKAKGGKPVDRNIRDLAWVVVKWAEEAKPDVIILENVEEFQTWGPLVKTAPGVYKPCPARAGKTFKRWIADLRRLGYRVEWRELVAADYGAPTSRKRLFVIARRDGLPIVWPTPTHGPDGTLPWRTAAEIIDWTLPCPSLFDTSDEIFSQHGIKANRPLAENTLARITKGVKRHVLDAEHPFVFGDAAQFLISYYSETDENARTNSVHEPLRTITTANRHAVVAVRLIEDDGAGVVTVNVAGKPHKIVDIGMRMLSPRELYLAQGFPADYEIDAGADGIPFTRKTKVSCVGNSVCPPVAAAIVRANCMHLAEHHMLEAA